MLEDETKPLPDDPHLDVVLRIVVGAIISVGGGFMALEFLHWLAHGGLPKFLVGAAVGALIFFGLVLLGILLSEGSGILRSKPASLVLFAVLVAGGAISHFFLGA